MRHSPNITRWNDARLASLHSELNSQYDRESPDRAHDVLRIMELVEDLDTELGELEIAAPSESRIAWGMAHV